LREQLPHPLETGLYARSTNPFQPIDRIEPLQR